MPNTRSARKKVRSSERKALRNQINKSRLKTCMKKALAVNGTHEDLVAGIKALDKAVSKGLIHKNNAARKKSKLAVRMLRV